MPLKSYEELLAYRLQPLGMTFEQFAETGIVTRDDEPQKYKSGKLRRDGQPGFNTASGKIEFVSSTLQENGYDPLPDFKEPPLSPNSTAATAADYPLVLISGTRSIEYYSTLGIEIPRLRRRRPWPVLEMAPETADELGLVDGEWVTVEAPTTDKTIKRNWLSSRACIRASSMPRASGTCPAPTTSWTACWKSAPMC